ncbi:thiazole tautomerase TenI [Bacillus weihaiensis]|uniref:Thiamine phosphate synthase/TenI domain-containing protein n=1 Tax=Bacillus weihaiensis TaxID=1547283 RepID=A0A1L3MU75_9BACI|nr:thiazole tautomerase TenI [Bacillus weihaiensis]APH05898.1 hypothetical protein A9C19_14775 [Bacillus weihaiensis]
MELHVITDGKQTIESLTEKILMIHREVDFIHIREKQKSAAEIMEIVTKLREKGVPTDKLIVNDRLDVALLQGLSRVHLPGSSFSIQEVKHYQPTIRIGRSVHSIEEAKKSEQDGADYLLYGHIFSTHSKEGLEPRGIDELKKICRSVSIPVIAIGGMTAETIKLIPDKVHGVAVMSSVMGSDDPLQAVKHLKKSRVKEEGEDENGL